MQQRRAAEVVLGLDVGALLEKLLDGRSVASVGGLDQIGIQAAGPGLACRQMTQ